MRHSTKTDASNHSLDTVHSVCNTVSFVREKVLTRVHMPSVAAWPSVRLPKQTETRLANSNAWLNKQTETRLANSNAWLKAHNPQLELHLADKPCVILHIFVCHYICQDVGSISLLFEQSSKQALVASVTLQLHTPDAFSNQAACSLIEHQQLMCSC
jgi:hypothetical protein